MKQPSSLVRVAGSPVAAIPLTLTGVWLIFMWAHGYASVWLALVGLFVAVRTISSVKQRSRYNAWRKEWDSVGTFDKAPPRRPTRVWRWATVLAVVLFIGCPLVGPQARSYPELNSALMWLWVLSGIFLIARCVIGLMRIIMKLRNKNVQRAKDEVAPVSLMLSKTLDSPSREAAVRDLPEYAARIMNG